MTNSLTTTGYEAVRHGSDPITQMQVLGERCSGTNYVNVLTRKNVKCATSDLMGWKHGFMQRNAIPSNTLLICSMRNSTSWIKSLFQKPWHATQDVQDASFSDFIRMPFETRVDKVKYFPDSQVGDVVQQDRHPITGEAFETPFAMRAAKHEALLGLRARGCNVVLVHFERVLSNPQSFLEDLRRDFGVDLKHRRQDVEKRHGWRFNSLDGNRRDVSIGEMGVADQAVLDAHAASEIEQRLGYCGDVRTTYPVAS